MSVAEEGGGAEMNSDIERLNNALADRYAIERELGSGGMATVYLAHDIRHERKVAVKVLRPEPARRAQPHTRSDARSHLALSSTTHAPPPSPPEPFLLCIVLGGTLGCQTNAHAKCTNGETQSWPKLPVEREPKPHVSERSGQDVGVDVE